MVWLDLTHQYPTMFRSLAHFLIQFHSVSAHHIIKLKTQKSSNYWNSWNLMKLDWTLFVGALVGTNHELNLWRVRTESTGRALWSSSVAGTCLVCDGLWWSLPAVRRWGTSEIIGAPHRLATSKYLGSVRPKYSPGLNSQGHVAGFLYKVHHRSPSHEVVALESNGLLHAPAPWVSHSNPPPSWMSTSLL